MRTVRTNAALILLAAAIALNFIILVQGDVSVGWPIAAIVLLGTAGLSLFSERRPP